MWIIKHKGRFVFLVSLDKPKCLANLIVTLIQFIVQNSNVSGYPVENKEFGFTAVSSHIISKIAIEY